MKLTGFLLGLLRIAFLLLTSWGSSALWAQCENRNAVLHTDVSMADPTQFDGSSTPESKKKSERIFGVVPTYTITDARSAPPLTPKQKFGLFVKGTLDPFPAIVYLVQAGLSQARDTHSGYGQGAAGYGKRFGAALADGTSARFVSTYAFPSLLHQDPRYFRREGSAWSRVGLPSRGFVTGLIQATPGRVVQHPWEVRWSRIVKPVLPRGRPRR
jgi:hypothetical protein